MQANSMWLDWYKRLSSWKVVLGAGLAYVVFQGAMAVILSPLGGDPLILQTTYSAETFRAILAKWGEKGELIYRAHYSLDFIHPFVYSVFLSGLVAWITHKLPNAPTRLHMAVFFLPYAAGACDIAENFFHLGFLNRPQLITPGWVAVSATFANTKWTLAAATLTAVALWAARRVKGEE